jgi:16S rRNA (guanine527-N7)-methyltransferase
MPDLPSGDRAALIAELERSRDLGFLGPMPVESHIDHAFGFADPSWTPPTAALDLGSGGGVPGLALATLMWPDTTWVLLDAAERRCTFLREAVERLDLSDRVTVVRERAEVAAREPKLRGSFDLVVARSFGPPAVSAECAAPFLRVGGHLAVSEPPVDAGPERWPAAGLELVGLRRTTASPSARHHFAVFVQDTPCPERYPRRTGLPAKRPLF